MCRRGYRPISASPCAAGGIVCGSCGTRTGSGSCRRRRWKLGQLLLFLWGSLPRMGSDLRERLTRRRKGAIRSGGRMRAFFEGMKLHPAVFVAGAVAVTAVAVCLSMYTIGATARYDGVELGTVRSARSVSAAVDQLEEITRQTLSDTDYSIDSAKLEVRTGIVARKGAGEHRRTGGTSPSSWDWWLCLCAVCGGGAGGATTFPRRHRAAAGAAEKGLHHRQHRGLLLRGKTWR